MVGINPVLLVLGQKVRACRNGESDHGKACNPIPTCQSLVPNPQPPIVSH
jgi:hypothetical protein